MNKYSFSDIEAYVKRRGLLKIRGYDYTTLSLDDFIKELVSDSYWNMNTVYAKSNKKQPTGSRRSVGDIYRVCAFYFTNVSIIEVYNSLLRLIKQKRIASNICTIIHKRVYFSDTGGTPSPYHNFVDSSTDEYGVDFTTLSPDIRTSYNRETSLNHYKII